MSTAPRQPFRVSGAATIKHLNVRKEGPDDERILAVDLKLVFEKLDRSIALYFDEQIASFWWRDDAMIVRNAYLQPLAFAHEIEGATAAIDGKKFVGCDVRKFSLFPRDGGVVDLTCSLSLYPSSEAVGDLSRLVQDGALVAIEGPPDLFDPQPEEKPQ